MLQPLLSRHDSLSEKPMTHIVGMLWNCNEGDILEEIIENALPHVDSLFIADDGSTDDSWKIIQSFAKNRKDKIEHIQNKRNHPLDKGQRQALLDEIRRRYKPESTWVQIIESDIMILDTDIRQCIQTHSAEDMSMSWCVLNAVREHGTWKEVDTYPNWPVSIKEIMPYHHWLETFSSYTFRPLPRLYYNLDTWRPWPQGWTNYVGNKPLNNRGEWKDSPLLAHYGYRGPTHFHLKFNSDGKKPRHSRHKHWDLTSSETVDKTVAFFNGDWNKGTIPMSRKGFQGVK